MARYQWGATDSLSLEEIDLGFRRYRLHPKEAEAAMASSLQRYGQLSPVVVCEVEGRWMLLDGFKRHAAARQASGMHSLWARKLEADATTAKAAIYTLNSLSRPVQALEEAWIVHALVREDGLSQPAAAGVAHRRRAAGRGGFDLGGRNPRETPVHSGQAATGAARARTRKM